MVLSSRKGESSRSRDAQTTDRVNLYCFLDFQNCVWRSWYSFILISNLNN